MVRFLRPPALLALALAAACGLGCGEDVLVSRWDLSLRASDAGAEETAEGSDAGFVNVQALNAQRARVHARKEEDKDSHENDNRSSSGEKARH